MPNSLKDLVVIFISTKWQTDRQINQPVVHPLLVTFPHALVHILQNILSLWKVANIIYWVVFLCVVLHLVQYKIFLWHRFIEERHAICSTAWKCLWLETYLQPTVAWPNVYNISGIIFLHEHQIKEYANIISSLLVKYKTDLCS